MNKIIRCEKLDNAPVNYSDFGDSGFNIHLDQMEKNQWYSFKDEFAGAVYYFAQIKDHYSNMLQIQHSKPNKAQLQLARQNQNSGRIDKHE